MREFKAGDDVTLYGTVISVKKDTGEALVQFYNPPYISRFFPLTSLIFNQPAGEELIPFWSPEDQIKIYNKLRNRLKQAEDERDAYKAQVEALKQLRAADLIASRGRGTWNPEGGLPKPDTSQRIATVRFDGSSGSMSVEQLWREIRPILSTYLTYRDQDGLADQKLDYLDSKLTPTAYSDKSGRDNG